MGKTGSIWLQILVCVRMKELGLSRNAAAMYLSLVCGERANQNLGVFWCLVVSNLFGCLPIVGTQTITCVDAYLLP